MQRAGDASYASADDSDGFAFGHGDPPGKMRLDLNIAVIAANAGIQKARISLDSRVRGNDEYYITAIIFIQKRYRA
jgi:hypothetical protein